MTASITEKQRQIWAAERAGGLPRFLLKRFVRVAVAIGILETLQFCFKARMGWIPGYPWPSVFAVYVLSGVFLSLLFLPFEWWNWDSMGRRLEGRPDSPLGVPVTVLLGGVLVSGVSVFVWWASAAGSPGAVVSYLLSLVGLGSVIVGSYLTWKVFAKAAGAAARGEPDRDV